MGWTGCLPSTACAVCRQCVSPPLACKSSGLASSFRVSTCDVGGGWERCDESGRAMIDHLRFGHLDIGRGCKARPGKADDVDHLEGWSAHAAYSIQRPASSATAQDEAVIAEYCSCGSGMLLLKRGVLLSGISGKDAATCMLWRLLFFSASSSAAFSTELILVAESNHDFTSFKLAWLANWQPSQT